MKRRTLFNQWEHEVVDSARNECEISNLNVCWVDTKHASTFIFDVLDDVMTLICSLAGLESQQRCQKSRFGHNKPDGLSWLDLGVHLNSCGVLLA